MFQFEATVKVTVKETSSPRPPVTFPASTQTPPAGCGGTTGSAGFSAPPASSASWWLTSTTASTCWWATSPPPGSSGGTTPWPTRRCSTNRAGSQGFFLWLLLPPSSSSSSSSSPSSSHMCLCAQAARQTPSTFLSRVWWNPVFNFLERNVQAAVPLAFSWPVTLPSSCRQRYRIVEGGRDE